jgi:CRP-like cAMP-binding protein
MNSLVLPPSLKALLPADMHCNCVGALVRKGMRVFDAGKMPVWMFYVVAGEVTLERAGVHGEPVVLQRTRQGFVSEASLKVARYHCDAIAISDTQVIQVPVRDLVNALDHDPAFASRWISMLNTEVRRLRLHLERLNMKSVRDRVLHLIETEGQHGRYPVPSGLKTLAGELGVTHEALYRTMAALEAEDVMHRSDGSLVLGSSRHTR